jgi:hypothetical protein
MSCGCQSLFMSMPSCKHSCAEPFRDAIEQAATSPRDCVSSCPDGVRGEFQGQFVERRSVSVRIGHPPRPLGACGDGPMHASLRGLWRAPRRRGWRGAASRRGPVAAVGFPGLYPSFPASCAFRVTIAARPPTGSPGAVNRPRHPQNVACSFPALRTSERASQRRDRLYASVMLLRSPCFVRDRPPEFRVRSHGYWERKASFARRRT